MQNCNWFVHLVMASIRINFLFLLNVKMNEESYMTNIFLFFLKSFFNCFLLCHQWLSFHQQDLKSFYVLFYDNSGLPDKHLCATCSRVSTLLFQCFWSRSHSNLKIFASAKKCRRKSKIVELVSAILRNIKNYIKTCRS